MSSTSNVQDLLVNVFRPTYRYVEGSGFTPALSLVNVSEVNTTTLKAQFFSISDSNKNTYIGSNAGVNAVNTFSNTAVGYSALGSAVDATNNVAVGTFALNALEGSSNNTAIGSSNLITGTGNGNILIGRNIAMGDGSGNILIGTDLSVGDVSKKFQLGTLLYGDLSSGFIGVNTSAPRAAFDISGITLFNDKVGFQNPNPTYSLDVNGSVYVNGQFVGEVGTQQNPLYTFRTTPGTGLFVPPDSAGYGAGSFGISTSGELAAIFSSNKVYFFDDLDVSGTFSARNVVLDAFSVQNGSAAAPTITFANSTNTGFFLVDSCSIGFTTAGTRRMVLLSNGDLSAGRLVVEDISYTGAIVGSDPASCNVIGGVTLCNGNVILTGTSTNSNLLVPGWIRNTDPATALDISGGNISNSGTTRSATFLGTSASSSNQIGGVTLSNSDLSMSATGRILAPILRDSLVPSLFDISGGTISNSALTRSSNFRGSNGSVAVPTYSFVSDPSTGIHWAGTSQLAFDTSGVQRMVIRNGNVGIGTSNPVVALEVVGDVSAVTYNGPGGTASAPHYTFSDDRATGIFFPGANIVGFTAGGTERMRISNASIGIGTTAPGSALDISGVLRIIGSTGNITFSNGTVDISGTQVFNASGTLSNASTTSNRIGGVLLSNADLSASRIFAPVIRNAVTATTFDISSGNISNAGETRSSNFIGTVASASNQIGGVTFQASDLSMSATGRILAPIVRNALIPSLFDMSGGNISNSGVTRSSNFLSVPGGAPRPGYAFTTDPSSGLDLVGTSYLAFDTSGVQRMCLSGNLVGIGTTAPESILDISFGGRPGLLVRGCGMTLSNTPGYGTLKIRGGAANDIYIEDGNVNPSSLTAAGAFTGWIFGTSSNLLGTNSRFGFYRVVSGGEVAGFRPFTIDASTGFIGMGTSNPSAQLQVDSSGLGFSTLRAFATGGGTGSNVNIPRLRLSARVGGGSTQDYDITGEEGTTANNYGFTFSGYGNSNVVRMDLGNRRLGINTSAPQTTLDISGGGIRATNSKALFDVDFQGSSAEYAVTSLNGYFGIYKPNTTNKALSNLMVSLSPEPGAPSYFLSNNIGIGTTAPNYRLDVNGTMAANSNEYTVYVTASSNVSVPTGFTQAHVTLVGGGGGGGGGGTLIYFGGSGGGGAGWRVEQLITSPATMTVTIGAGGSGGAANTTGGAGGDTTLAYSGITLRAKGGGGGLVPTTQHVGGSGGAGYFGGGGGGGGSSNSIGYIGGSAGSGVIDSGSAGGTGTTTIGAAGGQGGGASGNGGGNYLGGGGGGGGGGPAGGKGATGGTAGAGISATAGGPGCGGGGGVLAASYATGGAGGAGYCIIRFLR